MLPGGTTAVVTRTGSDSPVSIDVLSFMFDASTMRMSAGTTSPVTSSTTSPGTRSAAETFDTSPPRTTRHSCATMFFSALSTDDDACGDRGMAMGRPVCVWWLPYVRCLLCAPPPAQLDLKRRQRDVPAPART